MSLWTTEAFLSAYERGEPPDLSGWLRQAEDLLGQVGEENAPPTPPLRALLRQLVLADAAARRRLGWVVSVAFYLEQFPELAKDEEGLRQLQALQQPTRENERASVTPDWPIPPLPLTAANLPHIPGYDVLGEIGRGGMGVVYRARQRNLNRLVALKVLLKGTHASEEERDRFRKEAQTVAALRHPHIVQVYDIGERDGSVWIALEHCDGGSLADHLHQRLPSENEAAALVETLARAMHAAHQAGVVHRDLKPANVLLQREEKRVSRPDAESAESRREPAGSEEGEEKSTLLASSSPSVLVSSALSASLREPLFSTLRPRITDFGLAKKTDDLGQTQSGAILGTPAYMAPEQAQGRSKEVGPAADVYALGAILYECLTGRPPFRAATALDTLVQVIHEDPVPPRRMNLKVPVDLQTVCLKCLHKDPTARYASAHDLAEDLARFQNGQPVKARPVSAWLRAWKWARRHPGTSLASLAALLMTVIGFVGILWQLQRVEAAREAEESERIAAEEAREAEALARIRERDALSREFQAQAEARAQRKLAEERKKDTEKVRDLAEGVAYRRNIALAHREYLQSNPALSRRLLQECPPGRRGWEWHYLHGLHNASLLEGDLHRRPGRRRAAFSPSGRLFAFVLLDEDKESKTTTWRLPVVVFDALQRVQQLNLTDSLTVNDFAFSPDERHLAVATRAGVVVVDVATRAIVVRFPTDKAPVRWLAYSPEGTTLWALLDHTQRSSDTVRSAWELRGWEIKSQKALAGVRQLGQVPERFALAPDGRRVAFSSQHGQVELYDLPQRKLLHSLRVPTRESQGPTWGDGGLMRLMLGGSWYYSLLRTSMTWSPDGRYLATGSDDGLVRIWDSARGQEVRVLPGHDGMVLDVSYRPDGRHLCSVGTDRTVRVWDIRTGQQVTAYRGHTVPQVTEVAYSGDGRRIVSCDIRGQCHVWDATTPAECQICPRTRGIIEALAFLDGGTKLVAGIAPPLLHSSLGSELQLFDLATGRQQLLDADGELQLKTMAVQTGSGLVAVGGWVSSGKQGPSGRVVIHDTTRGKRVRVLVEPKCHTFCLAFHPTRKLLATGSSIETIEKRAEGKEPAGMVRLYEVDTGKKVREFSCHPGGVRALAFHADGRLLATGGLDGQVRLWDAETGQELATGKGHRAGINALAFHPRQEQLVSGGADGMVLVWDARTGKQLARMAGHTGSVRSVCFTPDGARLASASNDGTVRLWDASAAEEVLTLRGHMDTVHAVAFCTAGQKLASAGVDGLTRIWEACPVSETSRKTRREGSAARALGWHASQAQEAEASGDAFATVFHWQRVQAARPDDLKVRLRLAQAYGGVGNWDQARAVTEAYLGKAGKQGEAAGRLLLAGIHLGRQDEKGYRSACRRLVELLEERATGIDRLAIGWMCVARPGAVADYRPLHEALKGHSAQEKACRAAILWRAGKVDEARDLVGAGENRPERLVVLALVQLADKQHEEARKTLQNTRDAIVKFAERGRWTAPFGSWLDRLIIERLVTEAEQALSGEAK